MSSAVTAAAAVAEAGAGPRVHLSGDTISTTECGGFRFDDDSDDSSHGDGDRSNDECNDDGMTEKKQTKTKTKKKKKKKDHSIVFVGDDVLAGFRTLTHACEVEWLEMCTDR